MRKPIPEGKIDPKQDLIFRALFAKESNSGLLISLLNGLLELPEEKKITSIEYLSPLGEIEAPDDKQFLMDLFVKDASGKRYGIEMQIRNHEGFTERMLFYACRRYGEQLKKAEDYTDLKALVLIIIADFTLFPENDGWKEKFQLIGKSYGKTFTEHLSIVLVELKKFEKKVEEAASLGDKWLIFLTEGSMMKTEIKDLAWMTPELKKAIEELEKMEGDETQRALYEARKREIQIQSTLLKDRFNRGFEQGIEQGIEQGTYQATHKIAIQMMKEGESLEKIARLTGLKVEEIQSMKDNQN